MKKLSLLTITLISSIASLHGDGKVEKPHTCTTMKYDKDSTRGKVMFEAMVLAISKLKLPAALCAMLYPFINDLTAYEVNPLLEDAELYKLTHPYHVAAASHLTNGWNVIGASLATYLAGYFYYTGKSFGNLTDEQNQKIVTLLLSAYTTAQLTAIIAARKALGKSIVPAY